MSGFFSDENSQTSNETPQEELRQRSKHQANETID